MKLNLDWSAYRDQGMGDAYADIPKVGGDFAKAISVCNYSGLCKTTSGPVRCPSFLANGNPDYSPGGRVVLLKKWLNGRIEPFELERLDKSMAKCIACKSCKRGCENSIDMAQIKAEYFKHRPLAGRNQIQRYLIACAPFILYRLPLLGGLVKLYNQWPRFNRLLAKILGLGADSRLPELERHLLANRRSRQVFCMLGHPKRCVVWVDIFTACYRSSLVEKTRALLEEQGYEVYLVYPHAKTGLGLIDSGRSFFTHSLFGPAKATSARLLRYLRPFVQQGIPIIGLEPSSLLMLRDELLVLQHGALAMQVKEHAFLLEEFVAREHRAKRFSGHFQPSKLPQGVVVHGHCHQKSAGALKSVRRVLKLIPNLDVEFLDSTCCGSGGSFALQTQTQKIADCMYSKDLGAKLTVHSAPLVISNGLGCSERMQSKQNRQSIHLVELLYQHRRSAS